jgi:hypothetical protein
MDAFVTRFTATGATLVYSTVLGSAGNDQALDLVVDAAGSVYVTGVGLPGFPTTPGAYDTTNDNGDAFVAKISATGSELLYSTFIGGSGTEQGTAIAIDAAGAAYVTGFTNSANLATTSSALQASYGGGGAPGDVLLAKVNPAGSDLDYCSYYGGAGYEDGRGIAVDPAGGVTIGGSGVSTTLPFTSTPFSAHLGLDEAFFAKFMLTGLASVGPLGPGCAPSGPIPSVAAQNPVLGTSMFVWGANAPAGGVAQVYMSNPVPMASLPNGCPVYVDASGALFGGSAVANANGDWQVAMTVPPISSLAGVTVNLQLVIWSPSSPWGYELSGGLSLTLGN